MSKWVIKGLQTGIVTTGYPNNEEKSAGITPGIPQANIEINENNEHIVSECPTGALKKQNKQIVLDHSKCIQCYKCLRSTDAKIPWENSFEWSILNKQDAVFPYQFSQSLHIRVIDAGDCGACLNETKLLNNPYYNMHRLGFFITPTPRKADVLLVVGAVTNHMKTAIIKTYEAMPEPKHVMAVGACAINKGIFCHGPMTSLALNDLIPVDVSIPGCPPPPLAILHGLLVLSGRKKAFATSYQDNKDTNKSKEKE